MKCKLDRDKCLNRAAILKTLDIGRDIFKYNFYTKMDLVTDTEVNRYGIINTGFHRIDESYIIQAMTDES